MPWRVEGKVRKGFMQTKANDCEGTETLLPLTVGQNARRRMREEGVRYPTPSLSP